MKRSIPTSRVRLTAAPIVTVVLGLLAVPAIVRAPPVTLNGSSAPDCIIMGKHPTTGAFFHYNSATGTCGTSTTATSYWVDGGGEDDCISARGFGTLPPCAATVCPGSFPASCAAATRVVDIPVEAYGGAGDDIIWGGDYDCPTCGVMGDFLFGGDGDDILRGFMGRNTIYGDQAGGTCTSLTCDDFLGGGQGGDLLSGGPGKDKLEGKKGDDCLWGGADRDTEFGGPGEDNMFGGPDPDFMYGGNGADASTACGMSGQHGMRGGQGSDHLFGQRHNDFLFGGGDFDQLFGNRGEDIVMGAAGDDWCHGGADTDAVDGGTGTNRCARCDTTCPDDFCSNCLLKDCSIGVVGVPDPIQASFDGTDTLSFVGDQIGFASDGGRLNQHVDDESPCHDPVLGLDLVLGPTNLVEQGPGGEFLFEDISLQIRPAGGQAVLLGTLTDVTLDPAKSMFRGLLTNVTISNFVSSRILALMEASAAAGRPMECNIMDDEAVEMLLAETDDFTLPGQVMSSFNCIFVQDPDSPAPSESDCTNGQDDDGDGCPDCADPDCSDNPACFETACADGQDNDADGRTDCNDDDCDDHPACREVACGDGLDNDGDGQTDCDDEDCFLTQPCVEECADGIDNNNNAKTDCQERAANSPCIAAKHATAPMVSTTTSTVPPTATTSNASMPQPASRSGRLAASSMERAWTSPPTSA